MSQSQLHGWMGESDSGIANTDLSQTQAIVKNIDYDHTIFQALVNEGKHIKVRIYIIDVFKSISTL